MVVGQRSGMCKRMTSQLFAVCFDARQPRRLAQFWAGVLGREVVEEVGGALVPGDDTQVSLRFLASSAQKLGPEYLHLHLTSASLEDQQHTVATALDLGASHLDVGRLPRRGTSCWPIPRATRST